MTTTKKIPLGRCRNVYTANRMIGELKAKLAASDHIIAELDQRYQTLLGKDESTCKLLVSTRHELVESRQISSDLRVTVQSHYKQIEALTSERDNLLMQLLTSSNENDKLRMAIVNTAMRLGGVP
jgi:chromosome segregation ATPase